MIVVIQNEIKRSITVAAALVDGDIPDAEYNSIMNPSIAPSPPASNGIIPTSEDTINTSPIITGDTVHPNEMNTT